MLTWIKENKCGQADMTKMLWKEITLQPRITAETIQNATCKICQQLCKHMVAMEVNLDRSVSEFSILSEPKVSL